MPNSFEPSRRTKEAVGGEMKLPRFTRFNEPDDFWDRVVVAIILLCLWFGFLFFFLTPR